MPSFSASNRPALRRFLATGVSHAAIMGAVAMTAACLLGQASAQTTVTPVTPPATTATPAAPKPEEKKPAETTTTPPTQGETVTVVGEKPAVQNKIDRDVYDVSKDPDAPTSSGAEILNKVPGVNVDSDGNVTLRGQSNVQVQLNGRANAALEGDSRGTTLQGLSADAIESIEVIDNPSAAFSGSGAPIINIVLKKNRGLGKSGAMNLRYGSAGRSNGNASFNYGGPKWSVSAGLNYMDNWNKSDRTTERENISPTTGIKTYSNSHSLSTNPINNKGLNLQFDYNPTENDTLSFNTRLMSGDSKSTGVTYYDNFDANHALTTKYYSVGESRNSRENPSFGLNYEHRGKTPGEVLKVDYRHSESNNDSERLSTYTYSLPTPRITKERSINERDQTIDQLGIDYTRPLSDSKSFQTGMEVEQRDEAADNYLATIDPVTGVETVNASRTNLFKAETTTASAYITYQTKLTEKWAGVFGLRAEDTKIDLNSVTQSMIATNKYTRIMPSLNLRRTLGTGEQIRISYAERYQRPNANQMNPFITYRDPQNLSSGNPNLRPQKTDTIDASYTKSVQRVNYSAGINYRKFTDTISSVSYFIPNPSCVSGTPGCDSVLLNTSANSGGSEAIGVRFSYSNMRSTKWTFNISPSYQYTEYQNNTTLNSSLQRRSGGIFSANGNVSYRPTTKDVINANFNLRGASVQVQGRQSASNQLNLSYQHTINSKLNLGLQAQDVFNSQKNNTFTETANGTVRSYNIPEGQIVYLTLRYTLGRAQRNNNPERMGRMNGGNRGGGGDEGPSSPGGQGGGFGNQGGM